MSWLVGVIPHLKALHLAMLLLWCAGLFALPLMLARHDPAVGQSDYTRMRQATHFAYTLCVTPAAVIAIASGTLLIFLREVFVTWMFAKLVAVALLVGFHVWVGYAVVAVAETRGAPKTPKRLVGATVVLVALIVVILTLVLAKPELGEIPMPAWLTEPRGQPLPFDVPRR